MKKERDNKKELKKIAIFLLVCGLVFLYWFYYILGFGYFNAYPYTDFTTNESKKILEEFHIDYAEGMKIEKAYSLYQDNYKVYIKGTLTPIEFVNKCIDYDFYDREAIFNTLEDYDSSKELFVIIVQDKVKPEYDINQYKYANTARYEYNNTAKECKLYLSKPRCENSESQNIFEYKKDTVREKIKMMFNELKFSIQEKLESE